MMCIRAESRVRWKAMRRLTVSTYVLVRTWSKKSFKLWKGVISYMVMWSEVNTKKCAVMGSHIVEIIFSLSLLFLSFTLLISCFGKATMRRIDLARMQG